MPNLQSSVSDLQSPPMHVGIILDGNRRWARARSLPTLEGHRQGAEAFKQVALEAFDLGVGCLSAFVFSTENWRRTKEEVGYLMKLVTKAVENYLDTFDEANIRIVTIGRKDGVPEAVLSAIERTEEKTKHNTKGTLALCFNYGGEEEITDVVKTAIREGVGEEAVTTDYIASKLYVPEVPPLDLVIRTSGEQRLSGFMLYRAAYAELYFTEKYWPDFTIEDLKQAIDWYINRERRFGA